jgi:Domain of unknown function (DUF4136)
MNMRVVKLVIATALVFGVAIVAAQDVTYDYDRSANFSAFNTYAWAPGTSLKDELNHKRIVAAIDAQLAQKGLSKVQANANPDLLVAYHANFGTSLQITGFASGWGGYRFAGSRSGSARAEEIPVGTLIIDLVDAATRTIVWRGTATRDIDVKADPEKRDKSINRTAEKLFKNYPPKH